MTQRMKQIWIVKWVLVVVAAGIIGAPGLIAAGEPDAAGWVSKIISLQGTVRVKRQGQTRWQPVILNDTFFAGDQIRVEGDSRAGIVLSNDAVMRLDQNTTLIFTEIEQRRTFIFKLLEGAANFFSHRPRSLKILTPFVNGVVEGTEFFVRVSDGQTRIDLFEGRILAENEHGVLYLAKGEGAVAHAGKAPQQTLVVRPRESVQWAMYYPPVLALDPGIGPAQMRQALELSDEGQTAQALAQLEAIAPESRDATFFVCRAAILLHVGRIEKARVDLRQALAMAPENGDALALQAIVAVVLNRMDEAVDMARQAVRRAPRSASAHIALSYAYQGRFKLSEALDEAQAAVLQTPGSALAWARLADLQLSIGALDKGVTAARKAVSLAPQTAHAHTILGFAHLTRIDTKKARDAFNQAIALDSAAPLPRLGLGLAYIRDGDLGKGRSEIEIATGLDPGNALIRSYLGKAYFDEKRDPQDGQQLDIAKALDPNDPTPWFYDAIRKQSLNRPVEALQDLQQSIALNDNRAVYRSRLMLDEDLAAREASLGRIYNDLNFQQLAMLEGYKSLHSDSTNFSAHRLLADSYAVKPRHEIARVSELLQSQLFQPLNLMPIQARFAETDASYFEGVGPTELAGNEFGPLFTRNRLSARIGGLAASNDTWGDDVSVSGIYNRVSANLGQFHYETDGVRENNDYQQDLYSVFLQGRLTPQTNLQAEYRYSETEQGDRSQDFNGDYSADYRSEEVIEKLRIGGKHVFSSKMEAVASFILTDATINQDDVRPVPNGPADIISDYNRERDGYVLELRSDYKADLFSVVSGVGYIDEDLKDTTAFQMGPPLNIPIPSPDEEADINRANLYSYFYYRPLEILEFTVGVSGDMLERGEKLDDERINPKLGVLWQMDEKTTLRLAAFSVLSSTHLSAQTIEPTNVSGFNQFFDDPYGSKVWTLGAGINRTFTERFFGGIEFSKRDLDVPLFGGTPEAAVYYTWKEYSGMAYFYWIPTHYLSANIGYQYEHFDRGANPLGDGIKNVKTHAVPLGIKLFHGDRFALGIKGTYYSQEGEFESRLNNAYSGSDYFWIVDAEVSYRFPKRYGVLSIGVNNIFDTSFDYQDTDPSNPTISEHVTVMGKLTFSF